MITVEWPGAIAGAQPSKNRTWRFSVIRLEHPKRPPEKRRRGLVQM